MKDSHPGRGFRAPHHEPSPHAPNAALLIDFDNVTLGIRSDLQTQLHSLLNSEIIKGKVSVQRAYADWRRYPQYIVPLSEASIDLIFAPAFGSNKKNATDIRLAIDALEIVFTRPEIGTFILLSGDSDFSSLVLKLKEYGKYVIGVGIRESSSDLLIQNCDEYYSYTEITGLQKEGEVVTPRRDPWELVVEAVTQMKKDDDVMRSDRLKQVMQSIDPVFNEKDAGFSRFSRFVQEAASRGLLTLEKLENGQFAVDVGTNANVAPEDEAEFAAEKKTDTGGRRTGRRRSSRRRSDAADDAKQLTLAEAFELLRQSLLVLGAVGDVEIEADDARTKMIELYGASDDPVLQRTRFHRLLRQAHDATVIELTKSDGGYRMRLSPEAATSESGVADSAAPAPDADTARAKRVEKTAEGDVPTSRKPARSRSATRRGGRGGRGRRKESAEGDEAASASEPSPSAPAAAAPVTSPEPPAATSGGDRPQTTRRNPRFRRGSRGRSGTSTASTSSTESPTEPARDVPNDSVSQAHRAAPSDEPDDRRSLQRDDDGEQRVLQADVGGDPEGGAGPG